MKLLKRHYRLVVLAAACVALGAGVSVIASAGAATPASGTTSTASSAAVHHRRFGLGRRVLAGSVQGSLVVHGKSGWVTITYERGVVGSVSGNQLTVTERTKKAVYKTVTLTIPSNAKVRVNRQKATLSQVKSGQHVLVVNGPNRTLVFARG
jgi:hypothetical protein